MTNPNDRVNHKFHCEGCHREAIVELMADPNVCPNCARHKDDVLRICGNRFCNWRGWGRPGSGCPHCGNPPEDPIEEMLK